MQAFYHEYSTWGEEKSKEIYFTIRCFGAVFHLEYLPANLAASHHILAQHYELHQLLDENQDDDKISKKIEEYKQPFNTLMTKLAPDLSPLSTYLSYYLYPQHFVLRAIAVPNSPDIEACYKRTLSLRRLLPPGQNLGQRPRLTKLVESIKTNIFSSHQVQILPPATGIDSKALLRPPHKVVANEISCIFKAWPGQHAIHLATTRELSFYQRATAAIEQGILPCDIRISRLYGVIVDYDNDTLGHYANGDDDSDSTDNSDTTISDIEDNSCYKNDSINEKTEENQQDQNKNAPKTESCDNPAQQNSSPLTFNLKGLERRLIGILITYIEHKGTLFVAALHADKESRCRWAEEVETLVRQLHGAGLVWGDAKLDNVLVDKDNKAWLVDFGGSYTPGWVNDTRKDTIEGDLQGLERIKEWLATPTPRMGEWLARYISA